MKKKELLLKNRSNSFVARSPVFYGWVVLAVGTFGLIMTGPGQTYSVSIFIEHIIEDLSMSRSLVSTLYTIGTLVGSFALPFWGKQIDRKGARAMVVVISVLFGLASVFMGFVRNALMLGMGFIMVRMLGQGSLGLVSQTMINRWWVQKRGTVMGISGLITALLGMGAYPNLVYRLISVFDWRTAYAILGFSLLLIMAPLGYFFFRNRPEDYQLRPDGIRDDQKIMNPGSGVPEFKEENWTLDEAMKTTAFWKLIIALSIFSMIATGLFFHLVSIFGSNGLSLAVVASVFVPVAFASALANLLSGYLTDRIPIQYLLAFGLFLLAGTLIMAFLLKTTLTAILFGVILGATNGISRSVGTVVWPSFFGRKHLGSINGFSIAINHFWAAFGPLPFGFVFDRVGSYRPLLLTGAAFCLIFCCVTLTIRKPREKDSRTGPKFLRRLFVSS